MKKVAIVGIGHGKFGVRSDASLRELAFESVKACLDDAKLSLDDVEAMVTSVAGDEFAFSLQPSAQVHDYIGFHPKPNYRVEGACARGPQVLRDRTNPLKLQTKVYHDGGKKGFGIS
jgi:acetyl-CoA C-acetyltransferase